MSPIWRYYYDTVIYNIGLSILVGLFSGFLWGVIIFGTLGTVVGFIGYAYFKKNEYYFYYNYGYSKKGLFIKVAAINGLFMLVGISMYAIIVNLF